MINILKKQINLIEKKKIEYSKFAIERRSILMKKVFDLHSDKSGSIILFSALTDKYNKFIQDSSFYYFSGIEQPGNIIKMDKNGNSELFIPNYGMLRSKWIKDSNIVSAENYKFYAFNKLEYLGLELKNYELDAFFSIADLENFLKIIKDMISKGQYIFTLYPSVNKSKYFASVFMLERLISFIPELKKYIIDISDLVASMRVKKEMLEIELLYGAIEVTSMAFDAAANMIAVNKFENEIEAAIEYIFRENFAVTAYQSIVASGKNSTVLHYNLNNEILKKNELLLIDSGAKFNNYCADITRTFPIETFSKEQSEIYSIVLAAQQHVVAAIKPGVYLFNANKPNNSLHHIALEFLKKYGYEQYFIHGIGHFLGLDVHDVGDTTKPLEPGNVITIEPGIYIPEKACGIRIEDNYWIVDDNTPVCLSESIPSDIKSVAAMVKENF